MRKSSRDSKSSYINMVESTDSSSSRLRSEPNEDSDFLNIDSEDEEWGETDGRGRDAGPSLSCS